MVAVIITAWYVTNTNGNDGAGDMTKGGGGRR
jgi:hypothetical protein